jgi:Tfp pilus assembly protein PilF
LQIGLSYFAKGQREEARKEYEKVLGEESLEEKWINEAKKRLKELES